MTKKDLYLSPTQFGQWQVCHRSWWFQRIHKLKRKTSRSQAFGTVLHGVVERYLKSDPEHEEDLYPAGWNVVDEHGQKHVMGREEMERIKFLFDQSVEKGILVRQPGKQLVEEKRFMELIPGVRQVLVPDIMDLDDEGQVWRIQDCKTAGGTTFLEKPQTIMGNEQLLSYGLVALEIGVAPEGLIFRHNQFIRNEKASPIPVRGVDSVRHVQESEILRFADTRKRLAEDMLALRDADIEEEDWLEVPAMQAPDACEKYGGCSFAQICTKAVRSVAAYREMRDNESSDSAEGDMLGKFRKRRIGVPATPKKLKTMAAPFAKPNKNAKPKQTKPATKPIGRPSGKAAPKPEPQEGEVIAPWAVADCNACGGTGINKKTGNPCKICDVTNKRNGDERAEDFNARVEDGRLVWDGQDEEEEVLVADSEPAPVPDDEDEPEVEDEPEEVEDEDEPEDEDESEEDEDEQQDESDDDEEEAPQPKVTQKTSKKTTKRTARRGPKPQGLFLFIGCTPVIGRMANSGVVPLAQVFAELQEEFTEASGNDFWTSDAFGRRDWMAANAEAIKEKLGTTKVHVPLHLTPDELALVSALRGIATEVFEATQS